MMNISKKKETSPDKDKEVLGRYILNREVLDGPDVDHDIIYTPFMVFRHDGSWTSQCTGCNGYKEILPPDEWYYLSDVLALGLLKEDYEKAETERKQLVSKKEEEKVKYIELEKQVDELEEKLKAKDYAIERLKEDYEKAETERKQREIDMKCAFLQKSVDRNELNFLRSKIRVSDDFVKCLQTLINNWNFYKEEEEE